MSLTHVNPSTMHHNPAFSQGVLVEAGARLLVVGGQNGVDSSGAVVSADAAEQTAQALRNVLTVLAECGADQTHVAKLTAHVVATDDLSPVIEAALAVWGPHPTALTVLQVAALGRPDVLVEVDALAALPGT